MTIGTTRLQLLEYRIAFDVDGVLLVDAEANRIYAVEFPRSGNDTAHPSTPGLASGWRGHWSSGHHRNALRALTHPLGIMLAKTRDEHQAVRRELQEGLKTRPTLQHSIHSRNLVLRDNP